MLHSWSFNPPIFVDILSWYFTPYLSNEAGILRCAAPHVSIAPRVTETGGGFSAPLKRRGRLPHHNRRNSQIPKGGLAFLHNNLEEVPPLMQALRIITLLFLIGCHSMTADIFGQNWTDHVTVIDTDRKARFENHKPTPHNTSKPMQSSLRCRM